MLPAYRDMMKPSYRRGAHAERSEPAVVRGQGGAVQRPGASDPHPHPRGALEHLRSHGHRTAARRRPRGLARLAAPGRAAPQPTGRLRAPRQQRALPARIPPGRGPAAGRPRPARRDPRDHPAAAHRPRRPAGDPGTVMNPRKLLPSRADYRAVPRTWRGDLVAGITVGIVALPLALAFGVSSGAGAESGLVTAIVAGIVAAVFGGSNVQVSGPTGAMVVVLAPIMATHGAGALALICLLSGAIVMIAGALRLGRTISYIPWPVIEGFTLGIAVIIFLQQVPSAVGAPPGESTNAAVAAVQSLL